MKILAIDPGNVQSAYVVWDGATILVMGIVYNELLLNRIRAGNFRDFRNCILVIEDIRSYGMAVGMTIFETVFFSGQLCEAWQDACHRVPRMDVKMHLCHSSRAKDSNIRQALVDRFEPDLQPKRRPCGVLKGVSKDIWAALALAVYFYDTGKGDQ